jgi:hypothetical protein
VEKGLLPRDEMQTDCCYALQDKAWVRDPDGNEWEVFTVIEDNLPEKASAVGGDGGCCAPSIEMVETGTETQNLSCGCEAAPPPVGEASCCETQAVKFGIAVKTESSAAGCCAPVPVGITK